MRKSTRTWLTALGVLVTAGIWAAGRSAGGATASSDTTEVAARVVNVEVMTVTPGPFVDYIRTTGEVEALNDVTLSAEETGVIREFFVAKGAWVGQGEPIAKIDDAVLKAQVEEARAAAGLAREQYQRQRRVWEESHVGSEMALLQTRSQAEAAAARLAALESRLERTVIRAPVGGVFDEKTIEVGEMAMPGAKVGRVVATHKLKVTAGIPERFAAELKPGAGAQITFDIFPGREFRGRVSFAGSTVDPENRTFPVEALLDNPQGLIKPHMVANVQVVRARLENVMVVPQDVVLRTEDGYQVFVVAERNGELVAEARPVKLGASYANQVVITEGLVANDRLVAVGQRQVDQGSRIRIVEPAAEGAR